MSSEIFLNLHLWVAGYLQEEFLSAFQKNEKKGITCTDYLKDCRTVMENTIGCGQEEHWQRR